MSVVVDRDQALIPSLRQIADDVEAITTDGVDREARFPTEDLGRQRPSTAGSLLRLNNLKLAAAERRPGSARACSS